MLGYIYILSAFIIRLWRFLTEDKPLDKGRKILIIALTILFGLQLIATYSSQRTIKNPSERSKTIAIFTCF